MTPTLLTTLSLLATLTPLAATTTLTPPSTAPANLQKINPQFPSLAFELASFLPFSTFTNNTANTFSASLIASIANRTATRPLLRVGGTSGDHATVRPAQNQTLSRVVSVTQGPSFYNLTVSDAFFGSFGMFKGVGAEYVVNVPADGGMDEARGMFSRYWEEVGKDNMKAIELGNEPDLYHPTPSDDDYLKLIQQLEDMVLSNATGIGNGSIFQFPDAANLDVITPEALIPKGINNNSRLQTWSHHYYQAVPRDSTFKLTDIMNHSIISEKLSGFAPQIAYLQQNATPPIPFAFTEVGPTLGMGPGPDGRPQYAEVNNLGAALWFVDYQLKAMSMGVDRVHMQQIMSAPYSMWMPVGSEGMPPQVMPNYYAQPFVADFIGKSGDATMMEIQTGGDTGDGMLSAYAAFEGGNLTRVAIVNFDFWSNSTADVSMPVSKGERPVQMVRLALPGGVSNAVVQRLTAPDGAYGNSSLTWNDLQWTYPTGLEEKVGNTSLSLKISNGGVDVPVAASEAVMVVLS